MLRWNCTHRQHIHVSQTHSISPFCGRFALVSSVLSYFDLGISSPDGHDGYFFVPIMSWSFRIYPGNDVDSRIACMISFRCDSTRQQHAHFSVTHEYLAAFRRSSLRLCSLLWARLTTQNERKKCHRPRARADRRCCLSPNPARRRITHTTYDLCGVSTSRLPIFVVPDYQARRAMATSRRVSVQSTI